MTDLIGLAEVLSVRPTCADDAWAESVYPLPPALAERVRRACATASWNGPALLLAALARVEAELTAAEMIEAMSIDVDGGVARLTVPAGPASVRQWRRAVGQSPRRRSDERAEVTAVWAVVASSGLDRSAGIPDCLSLWHLRVEDGCIDVACLPSLPADSLRLLVAGVEAALPALCADDEAPVALQLIDDDQRRVLLGADADWNRIDDRESVCGVFDAVAAKMGDAIAIVDPALGEISYARLKAHADALATVLSVRGVTHGDVVAIALPRSLHAIAAALAVMKLGASYLPLDPAYPAERLAMMLQDTGARLALTDADGLQIPTSVKTLRVDTVDIRAEAKAVPSASADAAAPAYVMYTSGSTGVPKGVVVPHRAILRLVRKPRYIRLDADTRMLHAAPLGFDAATLEIWGPLLNGGQVIIHDETLPTAAGLERIIRRQRVTTAWLTAALFNSVVDEDPRHLAGLRQLFTGGDALSPAHVRRFLAKVPEVALHNGYGPTESTTFAATHAITSLSEHAVSVPIGRPIGNTRVLVLDPRQRLLPAGAVGELYIGGDGLALGYHARPELTAERFIVDPFHPGQRLYRTGDLARWNAQGELEFVGRADGQVKIRGFRIELGEIEAALAGHPAIRACAVLARTDPPSADATGALREKRLVAYYVLAAGARAGAVELRAHLAARLPDYMLPVRYIRMRAFPLTVNGKLDRRALPAPDRSRPQLANAYVPAQGAVERAICGVFAQLLDIEQVGREDNFFELGGSSLLATQAVQRLQQQALLPAQAPATLLFQHPSAAALADALRPRADRRASVSARPAAEAGAPIAIIAMAGRFPGAADVEQFWANLTAGVDSVRRFAPDELDQSISVEERTDPAYVAARGVLDGVDQFDPGFFGISPREAELMDPQQRIFLELCWECMERGGHVPGADDVRVGVFAGMYNASYFQNHLQHRPDLIDRLGAFQVMLDNEKDYIATRVAHRLDLTGPAISIHTACSTSLVAICQAIDSLRAGRCEMALAGGATVICPPNNGYLYQEGAMLSPDGRTRSFDAEAKGTVFSDGAAVVLLKRLDQALADGDPVIAVLRGAAVNNDGGNKASFTAPSADGQAQVIAMALADANVDPRSIDYVEAHGTATPLGDPIEIQGLTDAFDSAGATVRGDTGWCRIGSLKSNVGHMVAAAGVAGVIKTALAMQHRLIPASLHFRSPNPVLQLERTPFVVNAGNTPWPSDAHPRRAGVSSFGVGGTNAHVVMEEAPAREPSDDMTTPALLALSARSEEALAQSARRLADWLQSHSGRNANLADVAWTLARGRKAFAHRAVLVAENAAAAVATLSDPDWLAQLAAVGPARACQVVFLFPGQGSQYPGLGRELYAHEPAFRAAFDACVEPLRDVLGLDLRTLAFSDDPQALLPTAVMQPAIFSFEYALAQTWIAYGVEPAALAGHSVGEFVAATLAGAFSLDDALRLVARRGALMQAQPSGAMLSVRHDFAALRERLPAALSMAAENAPGNCVVAGPNAAIADFERRLQSDGIVCKRLHTSHAFHSAMMDPVIAPFQREVAAVARSAPRLPIISTVDGQPLQAERAQSPEYWARHLREPVRFASAVPTLVAGEARILLEVGPRTTLTRLARQHPQAKAAQALHLACGSDAVAGELAALRLAAGRLWAAGVQIDLARLDPRRRKRRLCLPTYPFQRRRCWVETPAAAARTIAAAGPIHHQNTPQPPAAVMEPLMSQAASSTARQGRLLAELKDVFEDIAGFEITANETASNFIELGMDSLMLTQVALQLQKKYPLKITFRQLMGEYASLDKLATALAAQLPPEAESAPAPVSTPLAPPAPASVSVPNAGGQPTTVAPPATLPGVAAVGPAANSPAALQLIAQQMQLMQQQLALLAGTGAAVSNTAIGAGHLALPAPDLAASPVQVSAASPVAAMPMPASASAASSSAAPPAHMDDEEAAVAHTKYDVKKAFGAIARIDSNAQFELSSIQRQKLDAFIGRYVTRTKKSKEYTQRHRAKMADPRVVNGFRPLTKEITYQIVIERSKGSRMWDLDGNEYVDALNGFGMSLFGWQPDFVVDAVKRQIDLGYEIGPQHPLAGEVAELVCEVTGHDRAALCNTGSEAVLGALRIARTVTGRETVVVFSGAYHGIIDEMIVRGTRRLRAVPAAPGILRNTSEHVLVLEYGTEESMRVIRERADEIAAVLVEPVQSRRPDFRPVEFLRQLREVTRASGSLLVFDEVVCGFRAHPAGAQGLFGIQADIATYGKVVGGGYPIGVIAGKREFMDALDGGQWQFGDDSVPTVGVTYFAGTFVRHPLALAAAKAVLEHVKAQGPRMQEALNARVTAMVEDINRFCAEVGAPVEVRHFASVWKTVFLEDHPLQDLLFAMMRSRGVHILDNFPCFLTTAHSQADLQKIASAFKESIVELQDAQFLPRKLAAGVAAMHPEKPAVPGARLGRDPEGRPAWYIPNPDAPGKYLKVG